MRIEGENEVDKRQSTIDSIRRYQETQDVEAQQGTHDAERADATRTEASKADTERQQVDGQARSDEAVQQANRQQDAGQDWQRYADNTASDRQLPVSVEELAKQERQQAQSAEDIKAEQNRISAAELLNDLAKNAGRFRG